MTDNGSSKKIRADIIVDGPAPMTDEDLLNELRKRLESGRIEAETVGQIAGYEWCNIVQLKAGNTVLHIATV